MKYSTLTAAVVALIGSSVAFTSGSALAAGHKGPGADDVIDSAMTRRAPGSTSGSGDTVEANCDTDPSGNAWQGATAKLVVAQSGEGSTVNIEVEDAIPNTHFTVWMRIKGGAGFNDAGSPWTGGGATPMCDSSNFTVLNDNSPWNNPAGSLAPLCNSIFTDNNGDGSLSVDVNFPLVGGAYPFQDSDGAPARPGSEVIPDVPTAIVDPRTGNGGPFMLRVISHCTDQANHGLSPAVREAWFQFP
jgi:hypothetical protein